MAEKSPFTYDVANPRWVTNVEAPNKVFALAGLLFTFGMYRYNRRYFRVDNNLINFLTFAAVSAPASYGYANFALNSAENEAAAINNSRESSS